MKSSSLSTVWARCSHADRQASEGILHGSRDTRSLQFKVKLHIQHTEVLGGWGEDKKSITSSQLNVSTSSSKRPHSARDNPGQPRHSCTSWPGLLRHIPTLFQPDPRFLLSFLCCLTCTQSIWSLSLCLSMLS